MIMKLSAILSIVMILLMSMASCKKDDDPNVTYKATLNGSKEVPNNNSSATGTATLTFNKDTKVFNIDVTHNVAAVTGAHIHKGGAGENGAVVFGLSTASPIDFTSVALDSTQEADLNAGLYYVNIHSLTYPNGEIRGQLIKQ